jgi:hypothetical protein
MHIDTDLHNPRFLQAQQLTDKFGAEVDQLIVSAKKELAKA